VVALARDAVGERRFAPDSELEHELPKRARSASLVGCHAMPPALVGEHRLADVNAPVVDEVHASDLVPRVRQAARDRLPEHVVSHVSKVLRLVGVRRRVLDDDVVGLFSLDTAKGVALVQCLSDDCAGQRLEVVGQVQVRAHRLGS